MSDFRRIGVTSESTVNNQEVVQDVLREEFAMSAMHFSASKALWVEGVNTAVEFTQKRCFYFVGKKRSSS